MSAIKVLTATYFLGAATFGFTVLAVLLAWAGVHILPRGTDIAWPIIGSFLLMMGSKYIAFALIRREEADRG